MRPAYSWHLLGLGLLLASAPGLAAAPDLLVADFEGPDYGGWQAEGTAFGTRPARGTLPGQMPVSGYRGKGLANSYLGADGATGTLTSPAFKLQRRYLNFLIGGGKYPGETCLNLLVGGQVVRTATGPNDKPGGSERLHWAGWDVGEFAGQAAVLQIVDRQTGGWGHINVDHILQSDTPLREVVKTVELTLSRRYLNFPVSGAAEMRKLTVALEGGPTRSFDIQLAAGKPDYWVFMDVAPFAGQTATISAQGLEADLAGLAAITQDDTIKGAEDLYREKYRPQFHFSSRRGWNNDPNGLVYHAGEYHLFYQHNPYGWGWGNMHWGHAVSPDLVHWQELPIALYPDQHGTCFSGSAVVDHDNTAGFQTGAEKTMVVLYTAAGDPVVQCLAYSNDRGRSWTTYPENPVLGHLIGSNRDPKVFWHAASGQWLMALYLDANDFALFGSPNLKRWTKLCDVKIEGSTECPEFFPLALDGDAAKAQWVFYGGNGFYLLGSFDGRTFSPQSGPHRLHYGNCFYASQTYNDTPDGRRVCVGWGTSETPGMPFNQTMTFPVELTLHTTPAGPRLYANPVAEIKSLYTRTHRLTNVALPAERNVLAEVKGDLLDAEAEFDLQGAAQVGFHVRGLPVVYKANHKQLVCEGCSVPLECPDGKLKLRVLADRTSLEIFANDGAAYMPVAVIPSDYQHGLDVFAVGGKATARTVTVHELRGIWGGQ